MKVLHLLSSNRFSGAENVVCQICEMFDSSDIKMVYCCPRGQIEEVLIDCGISYSPLEKMTPLGIRKVVKCEKPDVIHAHDHTAGVMATLAFLDIPIINHLHNNAEWMKKFNVKTFIYFASCTRYRKILTVSDSVMKEFIFGNCFKEKIEVISNPFDAKTIKGKVKESVLNDSSDIMYLGRLVDEKDPLLFIDIVRRIIEIIPNIRVAVVGDGYLKEQVINRIDEFNLNGFIRVYGFEKNPYGLLNNTKVLCVTSKWEGFGLAAAEALSLGKPVVAKPVGGLVDIIRDNCGRLCNNLDEFVDSIVELLMDDILYSETSLGSFERAEELSNSIEYKERLNKIYLEM